MLLLSILLVVVILLCCAWLCCSCFVFLMIRRPPRSTRTDTLFPTRRSSDLRAEHSWWYYMGRTFDSDVNDPKYAGLYGPAHRTGLHADATTNWPDSSQLKNWMLPSKEFMNDWSASTNELKDKYSHELIYFDHGRAEWRAKVGKYG